MSSEPAAAVANAVGARLTRARERLGWSRLQAAEKLHLDPRAIEALETEQFALLGAPVYVRGHLRRYAQVLGESVTAVDEMYCARPGAASPPNLRDTLAAPEAHSLRRTGLALKPAAWIAAALVFGALVWAALRRDETPVVAVPPATSGVVPGSDSPPAAPAGAEARRAAAPAPTSSTDSGSSNATTPAEASTVAPVQTTRPRPTVRATLRFGDNNDVQVTDASGRVLLSGIIAAGATHELRGRAPLKLRLANAASVAVVVSGRAVFLSAGMRDTPNVSFLLDERGGVVETP